MGSECDLSSSAFYLFAEQQGFRVVESTSNTVPAVASDAGGLLG